MLCKRRARQGCVVGTIILCVTIRPVYDALLALLGSDGFLFSYADDVYMGGYSTKCDHELRSPDPLHHGWPSVRVGTEEDGARPSHELQP